MYAIKFSRIAHIRNAVSMTADFFLRRMMTFMCDVWDVNRQT